MARHGTRRLVRERRRRRAYRVAVQTTAFPLAASVYVETDPTAPPAA